MKKRRSLQKIALGICLGGLLIPVSSEATEYTSRITGDTVADSAAGYNVTDDSTNLSYEFNAGDSIRITDDWFNDYGTPGVAINRYQRSVGNQNASTRLLHLNSTDQEIGICSIYNPEDLSRTVSTSSYERASISVSNTGLDHIATLGDNTKVFSIMNTGSVEMVNTDTGSAAAANQAIATGITGAGYSNIADLGDKIQVTLQGISGNATATGTSGATATTRVDARGVLFYTGYSGRVDIGNNLKVDINSQSGNAYVSGVNSSGSVEASSTNYSYGISVEGALTIGNGAEVTVVAKAGDAEIDPALTNYNTGYTSTHVDARGIYSWNGPLQMGDGAIVKVDTYAGSKSNGQTGAYASSLAYGIYDIYGISTPGNETIGSNNLIQVNAWGGKWGSAWDGKWASPYEGVSMAYGLYLLTPRLADIGENNVIEAGAFVDQDAVGKQANAVSYGVFRTGGGTTTIGDNMTIRTKTEGGQSNYSLENASATSYGYYQDSGQTTFEGSLEIQSEAKGGTFNGAQAPSNAYALYARNNGEIDVNQDGGHQILLTGDIATGLGTSGSANQINVNLDNASSYLRGHVDNSYGEIHLAVTDGARWQPTKDGDTSSKFNTNGSFQINNGGMIDLAWWNNRTDWNPADTYRTFTVDKATFGDGAVIRVNSNVATDSADKVVVGSADGTGLQYVEIGYDPIINSLTGQDSVTLMSEPGIPVLELQINNTTAFDVIGKKSTLDSPLMRFEFDPYVVYDPGTGIAKISYIKASSTPEKPLAETPLTSADAQLAFRNLWYLENDNMMRRLGDLRLKNEQAENGIWARVYHGSLKSDSSYGRHFDQDFTGMQLGYDREINRKSGKYYVGAMVGHLTSDPSYERGSGELKSTGFGAYGSWISPKGHYVDLVLRASRMSNDYTLVDYSGNLASGDYDAWAYGISAEYGYRKQLNQKWFVEPQAQVMFGHIGSGDHTTDNGLNVKQSSINPAWGRLGVLIGHDFKGRDGEQKGNVYLRGSWLKGLGGAGSLSASYHGIYQSVDTVDNDDSAFELNLGGNLHVGKKTDLYFELAKTFGGNVELDWRVNGGVRFSW